jgi:hypothetical protein
MREFLVRIVCVAIVLIIDRTDLAYSQIRMTCPYNAGISTPSPCSVNPSQAPIPSLGGGQMLQACADALIYAIASLYTYDDFGCRSAGTSLSAGSHTIRVMQDVTDFFPSTLIKLSQESNFHGTIYCADASNALILAFRGSVSPLPNFTQAIMDDLIRAFEDWRETNVAQHIGDTPIQYQLADDGADLTKRAWSRGDFDGRCGNGRPVLVLTGHSKGGGQAQFAAEPNKLSAVVFNSDLVNPVVVRDWMEQRDRRFMQTWWERLLPAWIARYGRRARSVFGCATVRASPYLNSGRIKDIRMTNDPLTKWLFRACGSFPHAPIEWISNTSTCSADGHSIETVVHELQLCPSR